MFAAFRETGNGRERETRTSDRPQPGLQPSALRCRADAPAHWAAGRGCCQSGRTHSAGTADGGSRLRAGHRRQLGSGAGGAGCACARVCLSARVSLRGGQEASVPEGRLPAARGAGAFPQDSEPPPRPAVGAQRVTKCPWPPHPHIQATSWGLVIPQLLTARASCSGNIRSCGRHQVSL